MKFLLNVVIFALAAVSSTATATNNFSPKNLRGHRVLSRHLSGTSGTSVASVDSEDSSEDGRRHLSGTSATSVASVDSEDSSED